MDDCRAVLFFRDYKTMGACSCAAPANSKALDFLPMDFILLHVNTPWITLVILRFQIHKPCICSKKKQLLFRYFLKLDFLSEFCFS